MACRCTACSECFRPGVVPVTVRNSSKKNGCGTVALSAASSVLDPLVNERPA